MIKKLFTIGLTLLGLGLSNTMNAQVGLHVGATFNYGGTGIINPSPSDNTSITQQKDKSGKLIDQYYYPYRSFEFKTGYFAGVAVGYDFLNILGVQAEINYSKQGGKASGASGLYNRTADLDYLQIPIMLKLTTGGTGSKFYFMVGASYSVLLNAKYTFENPDDRIKASYSSSNNYLIDAKENKQVENSDLGLHLGLGADIKATDKIYFSAGLRLYYSLQDLNTEAFRVKNDLGEYNKSTNAFGGLNIGVHYRL